MNDISERLRELWDNLDLTQNDIRRELRVSPRTLNALIAQHNLPPRCRAKRVGEFDEITEEEIAARAAAIRAGWTAERWQQAAALDGRSK